MTIHFTFQKTTTTTRKFCQTCHWDCYISRRLQRSGLCILKKWMFLVLKSSFGWGLH